MRQNWRWDINLPQAKITYILAHEEDPRFPRIAGALVSRVDDPKEVFHLMTPLAFCRRWRAIQREIESDAWTKEKAAFWKSTYMRLSRELRQKGEKVRKRETIPLDNFTRDLIATIRESRKNALFSQKELAELMGCSQQYISGVERGREKINLEFLKNFTSITNQPLEHFPWKPVIDTPRQSMPSEVQTSRQKRIYENLSLIGPGLAVFYQDACHLMAERKLGTQTHLVSHCVREIESGMRDVMTMAINKKGDAVQDAVQYCESCGQKIKSDGHQKQILAILGAFEIPSDSPIYRIWIGLAEQPSEEALHKRAYRDALEPPRPVDSAFLSFWNDVEEMLDHVLEKFREKFLDQLKRVDELLAKPHPTKDELTILKKHVANNPVIRRYFFDHCQNPEWLGLLKQGGFFKTPPNREVSQQDGTIQLPYWPQSSYLARMAAVRPAEVAQMIRDIPETDNVSIHERWVDAALAMPAEFSAEWVKKEIVWISNQSYLALLLPEKIGLLMTHLAKGGQGEVALTLGRALLKVFPDPKRASHARRFSLPPEPKALCDGWHYERVVKERVPDLVREVGFPALTLLCDLLKAAIRFSRRSASEGSEDHSYIWRESIEYGDRGYSHGLKNILVSGVRDAAKLLAELNGSEVGNIVQFLEGQGWTVLRRIALHLLKLFPDHAMDVVAARSTDRSLFDDPALRHEYAHLLARCFAMLRSEQQGTILGWIQEGPDAEQLKEARERFAGKRPTDEEAKRHARLWQRDRLAWFKDQLPEDWRHRYESLIAELGEPEHPDLSFHISVGSGPISPKNADELSRMSDPELVDFLKTWKPEEGWMAPSVEGLGRVFSGVVKREPERFSQNALDFKFTHPTYLRSLVSGITDALKEKGRVEWRPVFELCKWVTGQPRDISGKFPGISEDCDPDWGWTRCAIARLLSEGLQKEGIPFDQRNAVWNILFPLTDDPDPTAKRDDDTDPAGLSINSTRGEALHAVVRYALWVRRYLEKSSEGQQKTARGFDEMPEVRNVLETHLDTTKDPSLAIRAVYGQWFPWLVLIDSKWVQENLGKIFPSQKSMRRYYDAAWETYLGFCDVYDNVFSVLRKQYENAVRSLQESQKDKDRHGDPNTKLAEHMMVLYRRGLFRLDDPESIFSQFWKCAPNKLRAYTLEFIGRSLRDTKDEVPPDILQRLQALWESRLNRAKRESDVANHGELSAFGWWFISAKFDDEWAISQLYEAIERTKSIEPDLWVVERLAKLVTQMPEECVKCLELMVIHESTGWGIYSWREAAKEILGKALQTEAAAHAEKVINYLASKNLLEFRELLQKA